MGLPAQKFLLALISLACCAGTPLTIHIKDADNRDVEAEIIIQVKNPDRGTSIFSMDTTGGKVTLPEGLLKKYMGYSVEILVSPKEITKYKPQPVSKSVAELTKGPLTITLAKRKR